MKYLVKDKVADDCQKIVYALVFILVFEGILRKMFSPLSIPIFFLKDIFCVVAIIKINRAKLPVDMVKFRSNWLKILGLFIPLLLFTASKDLILLVFAAKQYLLYVITAILVVIAFPAHKEVNFRKFLFICSLLLFPTALVAILQNSLPASHWLNLSVGGESLEMFSSAGKLRVGSTFSFTAQYSYFLVAESYFLAASFFMQPTLRNGVLKRLLPFLYFGLVIALAISAFITGGRSAVLGCGSIITLGALFIGFKRPGWFATKGLPIFFVGVMCLTSLRALKPEYFAAYDARSAGTAELSHNQEIKGRLLGEFFNWTSGLMDMDIDVLLIGNGLGIMSNGSAQVSKYAAGVRIDGMWTEGDVATTFWEGGLYLMILWYGFRLSIILLCYRLWKGLKDRNLAAAASVPFAFVIIQGIAGTMAMQPPVAIWWWMGVGVVFFIYRLEKYKIATFRKLQEPTHEKEAYIH